jgi:hypothetical protein
MTRMTVADAHKYDGHLAAPDGDFMRWRKPDRGQHYRTCGYCGSIHPDDLATAIVNGQIQGGEWSDRKYGWPHKYYVDVANQEPGTLYVYSATQNIREGETGWTHRSDLTEEQKAVLERDSWKFGDYFKFTVHASHHAKLYSVHMADPDIGDTTKELIGKLTGLTFEFLDEGNGTVAWKRWVDPDAPQD